MWIKVFKIFEILLKKISRLYWLFIRYQGSKKSIIKPMGNNKANEPKGEFHMEVIANRSRKIGG